MADDGFDAARELLADCEAGLRLCARKSACAVAIPVWCRVPRLQDGVPQRGGMDVRLASLSNASQALRLAARTRH